MLLPDKVDCYNCIVGYGFSPDEDTCDFDPRERLPNDKWNQLIQKFRQHNLKVLDDKKASGPNRLRANFVKDGINFVLNDVK